MEGKPEEKEVQVDSTALENVGFSESIEARQENPVTHPDKNNEEVEAKRLEQAAQDARRVTELKEELTVQPRRAPLEPKLRPKEEWLPPLDMSVLPAVFPGIKAMGEFFSPQKRKEKKQRKELVGPFLEESKRYQHVSMDYSPGTGIEGFSARDSQIDATGFFECSGLIFQSPDAVSMVHLSPNIFNQDGEGGTIGKGEIVKNIDIDAYIQEALSFFAQKEEDRKRNKGERLSKEGLAKVQEMIDRGEIRATLLAGEESMPAYVASRLGEGQLMPRMKVDTYYVGAKEKAIFANPQNIYVEIPEDGKFLKKGVNFPSKMIDYEEGQK